jgi:hypothetical protein
MAISEPVPLHAVPGLRGVRARGRPKKIRSAPTFDARVYHEEVAALREQALEADPLVLAADGHGGDVLDQVIVEIAADAARLRWDRMRAEERGLEQTPMICSRIIDAYAKLSTLVLQRHELQRGEPTDAQVERVKAMFLKDIEEVVVDVLGVEVAETFMSRLRTAMRPDEATAR